MEENGGPILQIPSVRCTWPGDQDFKFIFGTPRRAPSVHIPPKSHFAQYIMDRPRHTLGDMSNLSLATNGPLAPGARASPAPQSGPPVPNGKPTSPYSERQNSGTPNAQIAAQTVSSKDPKAAAQAASDMRNVVRRKLTGYVGFANLPNQWHRKSVRKGFNFNVMVVGKASPFQPEASC